MKLGHKPVLLDVTLCVMTAEIGKPLSTKVLLLDKDDVYSLPSSFLLNNLSSLETAGKMLETTLGIKALIAGSGWVPLNLVGVHSEPNRSFHNERVVSIVYSAMINEVPVVNNNFKWVTIQELLTEQKILKDDMSLIKESLSRG